VRWLKVVTVGIGVAALVGAITAAVAFAAGPGMGGHGPGIGGHGPGMGGHGPGMGPGAMAGMHVSPVDVLSELTGKSVADIQTERLAGKSLADIATANGSSKDALVAAIVAKHTVAIDQAVTAGTLTQAQADAMKATLQARVEAMVTRTTTGPADAPGAGMGRHGRAGMPARGCPAAPAATSA